MSASNGYKKFTNNKFLIFLVLYVIVSNGNSIFSPITKHKEFEILSDNPQANNFNNLRICFFGIEGAEHLVVSSEDFIDQNIINSELAKIENPELNLLVIYNDKENFSKSKK